MAGQDPLPSRQDCFKVVLLLLGSTLLPHGASGQRVKVEPEVLSYPGQTVNLHCAFTDTTGIQLTMVTWIYQPKEGKRMNIAVLHPSFEPNYPDSPLKGRVSFMQSPPNVDGPSIQISNVRMMDEGNYICEFASYPSGHEQGITQLVMLTKPQNSASPLTVEVGKLMVVARCESLNGRPAAQIRWVTTAHGNSTTSSKLGQDNTVSVTSEYHMAPTATDNGKDISCVVSHRTQTTPESFQMKLKVLYAPQVTIVGYDNNWYVGRTNVLLTCQAAGNPVPTTVLWKSMTGEIPDTVQIKDNQLRVLKVDEAVNTTFVCEVKNRVGTGRDQVTVLVRGTRLPEKGATTGSIIGAIIGVILIVAIIGTAVAMYRKHRANKLNGEGPPKHKPPPPNKNNTAVKPVTNNAPAAEERLIDSQYYRTQDAEPVTDLDAYDDDGDNNGGEGPRVHYYAAAPTGWDDPGNNEAPPFYEHSRNKSHENGQGTDVGRGDSFVSPAMFV